MFFKFSYHYTQLKERNLLEGFFANIKKVKDAGCSFTLEQVPSDDTISCQDEAIKLAQKYVREYKDKDGNQLFKDPSYWAAWILLDALD